MANYNVDLVIALKGAQKLTAFNKNVKQTAKEVEIFNQTVLNAAKNEDALIKSVTSLSQALNTAKASFNSVALGTGLATNAAKEYLTALRNTNAALAEQKAAVVSLQNARKSDAFFLAQGAIAGKQNRIDEAASQAQSVAIARANNIKIQAELANQELLKEVQTRAPRLPAFQDRGLERLEDEFKQKKELEILEENANKASKRRLHFQEKQNAELDRQKALGIGINKNEKLINASFEDRVKFAEKTGKIRREALTRANNLENFEKRLAEEKELSEALEKMEKRSAKNLQDQVKLRKKSRKIGQDNLKLKIKEAQATRKLAENEALAARTARNRQLRNTAGSAIIGGAFPLLFGQTGAAAVGGGVGGFAGGAIGGQFGFALSILGTAIGSAMDKSDKFTQSLARLNSTLATSQDGFQTTAREVGNLAKQLGITKEEAINVLNSFAAFDSAGVRKSLALAFGDAGSFNAVAAAQKEADLAKQIFNFRDKIGNQKASELLDQLKLGDSMKTELALAIAIADQNERSQIAAAEIVTAYDRLLHFSPSSVIGRIFGIDDSKITDRGEIRANKLRKKFEEDRKDEIENLKKGFEETRELLEQLDFFTGKFGQTTNDVFSNLDEELKKLQNPMYELITLSEGMAQSFETSFKGIIKGTMTIQDAFRNMFMRIADHYLDMAARMMAIQFQKGIMGLLGNIFSFGNVAEDLGPSLGDGGRVSRRVASGGTVKRNSTYLVGEQGPELFSPGATGVVTPNHAMGATSIVVNVDASGSSVEGDEQQGRELGRLISVAVQSEIIQQQRPGGLLA